MTQDQASNSGSLTATIQAISTADEQWIGGNNKRTYVKYFKEGALAVKCDKTGMATSVKLLNAEEVEDLRKGVLAI